MFDNTQVCRISYSLSFLKFSSSHTCTAFVALKTRYSRAGTTILYPINTATHLTINQKRFTPCFTQVAASF